MSHETSSQSLLEELDARQNELLDELDRLNERIEKVLGDCVVWRGDLGSSVPAAA